MANGRRAGRLLDCEHVRCSAVTAKGGVDPPIFRFFRLRMRVRQALSASVTMHRSTDPNVTELGRTHADETKDEPTRAPAAWPRPSPMVAWETRQAPISVHRYVYPVIRDRVGPG